MNIMLQVLQPEFVNDSLTPPQAGKNGLLTAYRWTACSPRKDDCVSARFSA